MSIRRVWITSDVKLEGILNEKSREKGVLICHPHPLYGGSMDNNVVDAMESGFSKVGYTTLRFNFRGVGLSEGFYDDGEGEVKDVIASLKFLKDLLEGGASIVLAGYSFGAWIASKAVLGEEGVETLFLVAYPFSRYEAKEIREWRKKIYLIGGEYDEISPLPLLMGYYRELPVLEKHIKIIPTDHFFWGKEKEIVTFIEENFK
ncbi:MAG: hypothetical protein N2745_00825 [Syntrophorhabdaceae bacterium]|nr:hypothetical protein [Syntrophorhabdaceae bacterium]